MTKFNKIIKYFALALAISIIFNIVYAGMYAIYFVGSMIGDFSYNESKEINEKIELTNNITSLKINLNYTNLDIVKSDTLAIEFNNEIINFDQKDETLIIKEKRKNWFKNDSRSKLVIYMPEHIMLEKTDIETGAGIINIEILTSEKLSLSIGVGKTKLQNINIIDSATIEGGVGETTISSGRINNLDLEVGVGKFTLDAILTGNNDIEAGVGSLSLNLIDGIENYTIKASKGLGSISIDGSSIKDSVPYGTGNSYIDIEGGIGSISVK